MIELRERGTCLRRVEFALLHSSPFLFSSFLIGLLNRLLNRLAHDALKTSLDLSAAVLCQGTVGFGDVVPEKQNIEKTRNDETQSSDDPDEQGKEHGEVDDCLLLVSVLDHEFDVHEELLKV